ncbi:MAG: hypothetical protein EXS38_03370 [Opitutus sp.]|nr:hypothetical protein [Opitutus sp.]
MKKNYVYFVAPLIGLAAFAGVYMSYHSSYEAKEAARFTEMRNAKQEKIRIEALAKKKAVEEAIAAQEVRKKQKAEKEAKELEERDRRERSALARTTAREKANRSSDQVKRLEKQVADNKKEIDKIEGEKKQSIDEQAFIRQYVIKAEANQKALAEVLVKIEAADRAAAENARAAAAAAAAAAKKK